MKDSKKGKVMRIRVGERETEKYIVKGINIIVEYGEFNAVSVKLQKDKNVFVYNYPSRAAMLREIPELKNAKVIV